MFRGTFREHVEITRMLFQTRSKSRAAKKAQQPWMYRLLCLFTSKDLPQAEHSAAGSGCVVIELENQPAFAIA